MQRLSLPKTAMTAMTTILGEGRQWSTGLHVASQALMSVKSVPAPHALHGFVCSEPSQPIWLHRHQISCRGVQNSPGSGIGPYVI